MRAFLGRMTSTAAADDEAEAPKTASNGVFSSMFSRKKPESTNVENEEDDLTDLAGTLLFSAAQTLSDAIEDILADDAQLAGSNCTGFISLMKILESQEEEIQAADAYELASDSVPLPTTPLPPQQTGLSLFNMLKTLRWM